MSPFVESVTKILSGLTVAADVFIVFLVSVLLMRKSGRGSYFIHNVIKFLGGQAILFSFLAALVGTASSLFYSEIAGFAPCLLCWWQRIFLYPQVVILGLALWKKSSAVADYVVGLSGIGAAIAAYHTYIQFGGSPLVPCSATGVAVSCAQRYFLEFGYVTIPSMSLTGFLLIIIFTAAGRAAEKT